jgi:hypothetical protein
MNRLISSMLPPPKKRRSKAEAWVETHARRRRPSGADAAECVFVPRFKEKNAPKQGADEIQPMSCSVFSIQSVLACVMTS